jgi:flagellar basal-body rod protein FlgB
MEDRHVGPLDATQLALEQALAGASARQQILANNIANANTPNFTRSDLDFQAQLANAMAAGPQALQGLAFSPQKDNSGPADANGNNVDIDTEMSDMAQNALEYESIAEVVNARMKMIQTAIGNGV